MHVGLQRICFVKVVWQLVDVRKNKCSDVAAHFVVQVLKQVGSTFLPSSCSGAVG